MLLAGCFALLLAAGAARAQTLTPTTVKLVSNTGQPAVSGHFSFGADWAIAFTTGGNSTGYVLKRMDIRMSSSASPDYSVTIRSNASGVPGSVVGTLTKPDSYSSTFSLHEFTTSAGIELAADTTYWVVFDQENGDENTRFSFTQSDAEDADRATGWTIGNERAFWHTLASRWLTSTYIPHIAIHGYARWPETPTFYGASVNGTTLTVGFHEDLDASGTKPASSVFTVTATPSGGSPRVIKGSSTAVTIDGSKVTATLSTAVVRGETVTLAYHKPTDNPLRDTDDPPNEVEEFSGQVVENNSPPSVTGIDFAGVAPRDADRDGSGDSYRTNDVIEAAVTFTEAVQVTGTPTLTLQVGANSRAAAYHSGSGTATLAFRYTVVAGDADADGVSVPANPIVVPTGASIGDGAVAASLAYGGRAADGSRKVDAVAPTRSGSIAFNKANGSAGGGDELRFTVTFSEPVDVTGTPKVKLELRRTGQTRQLLAGYAGRTGARALVFSHTVARADRGNTAVFSLSDITDGGIVDAVGNAFVAAGSGTWLVTVDGNQQGTDDAAPLVKSLALSSTATRDADNDGTNDTYRVGDNIEVSVTFSEAVTVNETGGTPSLGLLVGTSTRQASYDSGTGTATLVFAYTVAAGDEDTDGVSVAADSIALNGGTLQDAAGNNASLVHDALAPDALHKVPTDTTRPTVTSAAINGANRPTTLAVTFNESLENAAQHQNTAFLFFVDGVAGGSQSVSVSGDTATVTFAANDWVQHGETLTLDYKVPSDPNQRIKDPSGNEVLAFAARAVTNNTPPQFSSAAVNGNALTITFDGDLATDAGSLPEGTDFAVTVGGEAAALADTAPVVSGSTVKLTLAEAVLRIDTLTVGYTPGTNTLKDSDKEMNPVPGFSAKAVTNETPADMTPPEFVSAAVNGTALTITFNEALDETVTRYRGSFSIFGADGTGEFVASFDGISGATVTATLATAVGHDDEITVTYNTDLNQDRLLKDLSGNLLSVAEVNKRAVTNNTPPAFDSAAVNGNALTITFDGNLDTDAGSKPEGSDFAVKATRAGTERDVDLAASEPVEVSGAEVTLTLAEAVLSIDTVTVGYTAGTKKLKDSDNEMEEVPGFSAQAVTNNTPADMTAPKFVSAAVNGTALTITFNEALDETVTRYRGSFSIFGADGTGEFVASFDGISGATVTATLATAVGHDDEITVTYNTDLNQDRLLKDLSGNLLSVAEVNKRAVTNNTPPAFDSAAVSGDELTITFDGALDTDAGSKPEGSDFAVKATRAGTERDVDLAASDPVDVSDDEVTLTLAEAVLSIDTVTVGYTPGTKTLKDSDNAMLPVPGFTGKAVTNDPPAGTPASVTGIAFTGSAPRDVDRDGTNETYAIGDAIEVEVTFSRAVTVDATDGTPALNVQVGANARTATYQSGSGSPTLAFRYAVAAGDADGDGVAMAAGTIALNSGWIGDSVGAASLSHEAVAADASHRVDGVRPSMTQATRNSGSLTGGAFGEGETVRIAMHFSEPVFVTGAPTLGLVFTAGAGGTASYVGKDGSSRVVFEYVVKSTDNRNGGVANGPTVKPLAGTVVDAAGNGFAPVFNPGAGKTAFFMAKGNEAGGGDAVAPLVKSLALSSTATLDADNDGTNETYGVGDAIEVSVTFSEAVTADTTDGIPSLALQVGTGAAKQASYHSGSGNATLVFRYTVAAAEEDTDGVSVAAGSIALNGGTLKDAAGNDATLAHDALAPNALHKVDGTKMPATVSDIAFAGSAARDADRDGTNETYAIGDVIEVEVTFSRAVEVTGAPTLNIQVGASERAAAYASGSGTATLLFRYAVVAGDADGDGMSVPANPFTVPDGARIGDAAGSASLGHGAVAADASRRVDGVGPRMTEATRNSGSLTGGAFGEGETVRIAMHFSEPVLVTGAPTLELVFTAGAGGTASYVGKDGSSRVVFEYVVKSTDNRNGGVANGPTVKPLAGTVVDAAGNGFAPVFNPGAGKTAFFMAKGNQAGGGDVVGPLVQSLALSSTATRDADNDGTNDTYGVGDAVDVSVTFSEAVTADTTDGIPSLALQVGTGAAKQASYHSGSGNATLVFRYTVAAAEEDTDGVSVAAGSIALNGGTLKDAAGNDATLAHDALAPNALHKVDGTKMPATVSDIAFAGSAARDADRDGTNETYAIGDVIEVEVTFSRAVEVTGAPTLNIQVGASERAAAYASGSGTATLLFRYAVVAGDADGDGMSVPANPFTVPDGARIGDAAGSASLGHGAVAADASRRVDGVGPRMTEATRNSGSLTGGAFGEGETVRIAMHFSEPVLVTGAPTLELVFTAGAGGTASYAGKDGSSRVAFEYVVKSTDNRNGGVANGPTVKPLAGTVVDAAGNGFAAVFNPGAGKTAFFMAKGNEAGGGDVVAPLVKSLALSSTATRDADGDGTNDTYYRVGDPVDVSVTFSEAVTVDATGGTPSLALQVGTGPGKQASYHSGSGGATLVFRYAVASGDEDADGVSVAAGSIALNGGTLKDAADNDATLAHDALAPDALHKVDGTGTLNRAPRPLWKGGTGANVCAVLSAPETTLKPNARFHAPAGQLVGLALVTREGETTEWPASCTKSADKSAPVFDDPDGDELTIEIEKGGAAADLPDNVREFSDGTFDYPVVATGGRLLFNGVAALRQTNHDMKLSATDPQKASVMRTVRIVVGSFEDAKGAPEFDGTVSDQHLAANEEMTALVLPEATGGDLVFTRGTNTATFGYYYAVSNLPKGLTFTAPDPEDADSEPTISGTPTQEGTFTVEYTADDADTSGSAHLNTDVPDESDVAKMTFTICVGACGPTIELVRIVSAPTFDSDNDGKRDTFVQGDEIFVDVEFNRAVKIKGDANNVTLHLDLGADDTDQTNSRKVLRGPSVLHGGMTLRFAYTVAGGNGQACTEASTTADCDTDGLWVQTDGSNAVVITTADGGTTASVVDPDTDAAADLTMSGLPTSGRTDPDGDVVEQVDGSKTAADIGPRPTGATVDGATVTVTYNGALDTSVDTSKLPLYFAVSGAGLNGGNRNAFQHPSEVSIGGDNNEELILTLAEPARVADTVTVGYELRGRLGGPLKGADGKMAPAFVNLAVTNETGDLSPWRASVAGTTLRVVLDGALDESSAPAGTAFLVETSDADSLITRRSIRGTGTAMVEGTEVTVQLAVAVRADELALVSYAQPGSKPLQSAGGAAVRSFERFRVETVRDVTAPVLVSLAATEKASSPKAFLYFDETLDENSVLASGDFAVTVDGVAATVSDPAVNRNAVELTLGLAVAAGDAVAVSYTPGDNLIRDESGNPAAAFEETATAVGSGTPAFLAAHVVGSRLKLSFDRPLDPDEVPKTGAFQFHSVLDSDETEDDRRTRNFDIGSVLVQGSKVLLRLDLAWFPCGGETPFTVSYTKPTDPADDSESKPAKLKAIGGAEANGFSHEAASNERAHLCGTDWLDSAEYGSVILRARRPFATDVQPEPEWFRVTASGGPVTVTGAAFSPDDAHELKLTLSREFGPDETVAVSYSRPLHVRGLWNADGKQLADFTNAPVTKRATGPPSATAVAVVSDAGDDATYGLGETIEVEVTFSEAVEVDASGGAPRLKIDLDPAGDRGEQWAVYESGGGTAALMFAYEVAEPNESTAGIAVLADTLVLNGGTIRSAATAADANLGHAGLDHDPAHKVDWTLAPAPPAVAGAEVTSEPGADGAYTEGETIEAAVTFSAPVTVDTSGGTPTLALIADGSIRRAPYASGSGTARLVFSWRVTEADGSVVAVRVAASGLKLNGGTIAGADGKAAGLGFGAAPGVTSVSIADQADGRWAGAGDKMEVTLGFAEPVTVEGTPTVELAMDGTVVRAGYAGGSGSDALTFAYTLDEAEGPWSGAAVSGDSLRLDGGSIVSAGGGLEAALSHPGASRTLVPAPKAGVWIEAPGTEGGTLAFAVRLDKAGAKTVTVDYATDDGTAVAGEDYTATSGRLTFAPGETAKTVEVALLADDAVEGDETVTLRIVATNGAWLANAGATGTVTDATPAPPEALTASFVDMPAEHNGKKLFGFEIRFSEEFDGFRLRALKAGALTVTGGRLVDVKRAVRGENRRVTVRVRPASYEDMTITLSATADCAAPTAICARDGRKLATTVRATVLGPALLSVADARAREGVDAAVAFPVSLSRAAQTPVTVDYATADGTAKAGEDYTATSGTLTFAPGEVEKTVAVPVLDDGHDEGEETFLLRLSNATGAVISDRVATGTIENSDKMPKAWLARFGRTVAEQTVEAVQARLEAPRRAGAQATLGGQALPSWTPGSGSGTGGGTGGSGAGIDAEEEALRDAERLTRWLAGEEEDEKADETRGMTSDEVLVQTAFSVTAAPEGGPSTALWGRGATSRFSGREGPLTIDGEVTSATLGADWRSGRWLAGAMVTHSLGEGSYAGDGGAGEVESQVTGIYPYAGYEMNERVTVWGAVGYGEGRLTLTPKNPATGADDAPMETDMSLGMAALGAKGRVVEAAQGDGFRLDLEADAFWVRTSSEKAPGLAGALADVTRLRLGLDGGYGFALDGGGSIEPSFEIGLRHDGGDAETGYGVDLGGGVTWRDPALGLSANVAGRGLIAHEAAGLRDRGVSGSLAWDPAAASDRGPSVTVTQTMGASATGGVDALLGRQTLADPAANDNGFESRRLEVKLGYGFPAFGDRFTSTPGLGLGLSNDAREYSLGWKLGLVRSGAASFDLGIEATRREPANHSGSGAEPEHRVGFKLEARF